MVAVITFAKLMNIAMLGSEIGENYVGRADDSAAILLSCLHICSVYIYNVYSGKTHAEWTVWRHRLTESKGHSQRISRLLCRRNNKM